MTWTWPLLCPGRETSPRLHPDPTPPLLTSQPWIFPTAKLRLLPQVEVEVGAGAKRVAALEARARVQRRRLIRLRG